MRAACTIREVPVSPLRLSLLSSLISLCAAVVPASAADATPPAAADKPATTVRVGGSPADAAFRAAQTKSGEQYQAAKARCAASPRQERAGCMKAAKGTLRQARLEARAAHDGRK